MNNKNYRDTVIDIMEKEIHEIIERQTQKQYQKIALEIVRLRTDAESLGIKDIDHAPQDELTYSCQIFIMREMAKDFKIKGYEEMNLVELQTLLGKYCLNDEEGNYASARKTAEIFGIKDYYKMDKSELNKSLMLYTSRKIGNKLNIEGSDSMICDELQEEIKNKFTPIKVKEILDTVEF